MRYKCKTKEVAKGVNNANIFHFRSFPVLEVNFFKFESHRRFSVGLSFQFCFRNCNLEVACFLRDCRILFSALLNMTAYLALLVSFPFKRIFLSSFLEVGYFLKDSVQNLTISSKAFFSLKEEIGFPSLAFSKSCKSAISA